ncbi:MAG: putative membrane protein [Candidatus Alkanophagales archaeon MCA70_species_1]|nr:putative membrane protein [Candidatus Alkanophaga volatiphilum]
MMNSVMFSGMTFYLKIIALTVLGVVLANVIVETGATRRLFFAVEPLCRLSKLPEGCVVSLLTCFLSPTAGKSMLAGFYQRGEASRAETIVTVLMSTFPTVLGETLLRVQAPLAIVVLGPVIGTLYVALTLFSAFIQALWGLVISRVLAAGKKGCRGTRKNGDVHAGLVCSNGRALKDAVIQGIRSSGSILKRIIPAMLVALLVMDVLTAFGFMDLIATAFSPLLRILSLPGECITALIAQFAHFSAGYAAVAFLLENHTITNKQALITLLLGSMIVITMIYVKYSFAMYVSLFGRFGVEISAAAYASSMLAKIITILIVLLL